MRASIFLLCTLTFVFLVLSASTSSCDDSFLGASSYLNSQQTTSSTNYRSLASQYGIEAGIPSEKFVKEIQVESGFNPSAVSPMGAIGIAQIMPSTAQSWNVNPHDPVASLKAASQHMAWYQNTYGGYAKALAC